MKDNLSCRTPGSDFTDTEAKPGLLLWELTNLWQRHINNVLAEYDLTHVQFFILKGLKVLSEENKTITQIDLSKFTRMNVMMVSKVVRSLEEKNFVKRVPHPIDTRAKCLEITELGEKSFEKGLKAVKSLSHNFFQNKLSNFDDFIEALKTLLTQNTL